MKKLYNMLIKENEEKGGYDITFPEYPGLTAHAEPGEDAAKVGYEAKEIEENIAEIHRLQAANV